MDKYIGRLLDNRYEILEAIGTGGMAVVYKARCHRLNRLVAIKILKDDYLEDEEFRRRFHSESQAVAMLSHPNIVSVYDVSTSITADYIVMELIDGITLKQYMEKKGVLNWKETLHFAIQIAKALEHAHSRGIVHRDIKPHNVMVLKNGSVKVTDFGIARMMSKGNTLTKEALGSVHYISPEQARGGRVDNRSDIYSLGAVMYEMMSGRPPYDGESPVAVAIQHINGGAPLPSTLNPNIPGGLEQIIMKAMALEADSRYETATAMLTDLDEFRKNPAILFDYNVPPTDAVLQIPKIPAEEQETQKPQTTAQRVEDRQNDRKKSTAAAAVAAQRRRSANTATAQQRRNPKTEEKDSNVATIAIIVCSVVMLIAIVIFLVVLLGNGVENQKDGKKPGSSASNEMIEVPDLEGENYLELPEDLDLNIIVGVKEYNDQFAENEIISHNPVAGTQVEAGSDLYLTVSLGPNKGDITMPDLKDRTEDEAIKILQDLHMDLQITEPVEEYHDTVQEGLVIKTNFPVGTTLDIGDVVTLYISKGKEITKGSMPALVDQTKEQAKQILDDQEMDLVLEFLEEHSSIVEKGCVTRTTPEAGEEIQTGQTITVYISKGPETKKLPDILSMNIVEATSALTKAGFTNYESTEVESDQDPYTVVEIQIDGKKVYPGNDVDINAKITLVYAKAPEIKTVTKDVEIGLRNSAVNSDCEIVVTRDGKKVFEQKVTKGTASITINNQTGSGLVTYVVTVNDQDSFEHPEVFS